MDYEKLSEIFKDNRIAIETERAMEYVGHHFKDITQVEEVIYKNLIRTVERNVIEVITPNFVRRQALRIASDLIKRNRYTDNEYTRFGELDSVADDGSEMTFEPEDSSADNGGQALLTSEIVDLIVPKGDERRAIIVNEWLRGETNDRDIARYLVETLGGKLKTHVTFITRYRKECQLILGGLPECRTM